MNKDKKSALQTAGRQDILSLCDYEQAIVGNEGLESFRRKHRYGMYIFKIQNHRIVSAEGQPKIFGQLWDQTLVKEASYSCWFNNLHNK